MKRIVPLLVLALSAVSCSLRSPLPSWGVVPDFQLTDQTGKAFVSKERLDGHIWVGDFIFTNCTGPCPRMSTQMNMVQRKIANPQVRYVSFTIDPERDTPAVLAEYGKRYKADPANWFLLTGTKPELKKLNYDTFHLGDLDGSLEHSTRFVLVDSKSRIRGYYDTSEAENIRKLISDIQGLLRDAS